uniref:Tail protein n=1 Tax=viral metagenome TaxID=1070528 RepID=A0A6M3LDZ8_9ZZZZ
MVTVNDYKEIKEEIVVYLRNQDILTTTQREVTTTTATGTFAATSSLLINKTNIKNIRSIVVVATTLSFGTDYTVDYYYNDSGTRKCNITFTSAQTGAYVVTYDYGTDKIFADRPRTELRINQFPRISVEIIGDNNVDADLPGDLEESVISFSITVYDDDSDAIDVYLKSIRTAMIGNKKSFYYLTYARRINTGPLLPFPLTKGKVMLKAVDYLSPFNFETTT